MGGSETSTQSSWTPRRPQMRVAPPQPEPDDPRPVRLDIVSATPDSTRASLITFVGMLGLVPEDVCEIAPIFQGQDDVVGWEVLYRDRPEYAEGRARWASAG